MGSGSRLKSEQYRILAEDHERRSRAAKSKEEKAELLRKAKAYRDLAETEDWLEGVKWTPPQKPRRTGLN